jgi:hypothetical protein
MSDPAIEAWQNRTAQHRNKDQKHLDHLETHDRHKWLMQHGIKCICKECKHAED